MFKQMIVNKERKFNTSGYTYAFRDKKKAIQTLLEAQKFDPFEEWNVKLDTGNPGETLGQDLHPIVFEITLSPEECAAYTIQVTQAITVYTCEGEILLSDGMSVNVSEVEEIGQSLDEQIQLRMR